MAAVCLLAAQSRLQIGVPVGGPSREIGVWLLTLDVGLWKSVRMKMTSKGQITIPPALRKKHGLVPQREVELLDQPGGVLIVKAGKLSRGKRVLAALLDGGKVKGDTESWLRVTRGAA